ncbi:MAG TPA: Sua5/YciO/YrdC/YwlC family protein [Treponema sp.]|nr:MAG: translation factor Sua5 [Treponema sp. GWA1_62_8]OHE70058.1 MAG: translation factor Sua5 [Treponema sp. GWC1_61_84]HCM25384.1 Sua5/YciO/YrdC/YwlC family protein [Treponema sp.]
MIEYIVAENIDDRILARSSRLLSEGGLVAFPTDTSWTVACSLASKEGIRKLKRLSGERDERHFTLLCSAIAQIGDYCALDNTRFRLVKRLTPGPYVFVLRSHLGTEKALDIRRKEVGVRIPDHPVPRALVNALGSPLYSVTAKKAMAAGSEEGFGAADAEEIAEGGLPTIPEEELFEGGWELEAIEGLELVLDTGEERPRLLSTVLDLADEEPRVLRIGAGAWPA